ncbi:MAG: ATP-binding protein, partial [Acidobacteriota bacterium]|nr:ATP-binding protein [Acidobacteriota bacterium]
SLAHAARSRKPLLLDDLPDWLGARPVGHWPEAPRGALVLPLAASGSDHLAGLLVVGVSPRRALDDDYRSFFNLVAGHAATAIANARAYEEERQRAEALADLDRAKTAFFSNVSHEFRTPLTLLLGPAEDALADAKEPLPAAQRERIEVIHRNGLRLFKLVNTLLDFSRIEAGRVQAVYEPVDLAALTAELASVFRSAVERAGLRLLVDCPPLPEPIHVDREMWEKIVLNLLSNAFKFTFAGEIGVSLRWTGDRAELSIRDTGTGIPEEELPHIFERFHRVRGARGRTYEGSGIGLALVQELIRLHGGSVRVASRLGAGTTFTLSIPAGSSHLPAERTAAAREEVVPTAVGAAPYVEEALRWLPGETGAGAEAVSRPAAKPVSGDPPPLRPSPARQTPGARILLADDNADMREYVCRLIGGLYEVEVAGDGESALQAARERHPDLVLSDVMMPRLDGFGLLRGLREDPRTSTIPVILLSARAGEESRVEGLEAGADDYLIKPFTARELIARVGAHLEMARIRNAAQQAVRESEERLNLALANAGMGTWDWDLRTDRSVWSPAAYRILGYPSEPGALPDGWWQGCIHPDDRERVMRSLEEARVDRSLYNPQYRVVRADDGRLAWLETTGRFIYDEAGRPIRMIGVLRDITERQQAEAERERLLAGEREARREAEVANRLKDEFLATVSHELRTPLNAILGWASLLREDRLDAVSTRRARETIERNARAQNQLIEDLLDVSRIISGKLRLDVRQMDVAAVVEAALDVVRPTAGNKGVRLQSVLDPSAGPVAGDPDRLQQVVWNLLSNAIKFTPKGGRVMVRLERVNSHVEIVVEDTGIGIAPEFQPYIFERFRQADSSTTRVYGGLGLGLAIVRHLTDLHGGTVRVESAGRDRGTMFAVSLPLSVAQAPREPPRGVNSTADAGLELESISLLRGVRVLVVDDEPDARTLVAAILGQCGASVVTAGSVAEGLAALEEGVIDVILSDIEMPGEDGYSFIREVREREEGRERGRPAAALTAYGRAEDRRRSLAAGFQMHVSKPVEPAELVAVVANLAGRVGKGRKA